MGRVLFCILSLILMIDISYAQVAKRVLMVIAPVNFRDEELFETKRVLSSCGAKVDVASVVKGTAKGMMGGTYEVDLSISEVDLSNYSAVVFVGGTGATALIDNRAVLELARDAYRSGRVVGAICISPSILARAGILKGKRATVWSSMADNLVKAGAIYTGRNVEVDGRIVTANGPWAAREFAESICRLLGYR